LCLLALYTAMCSEKHPLMFSIITPVFLGRFLYFLYQWKEKWIPYNLLTYSLDDVITASLCTVHATKVYFMELLLNIKYIELWIEFEDKILIKNLWKFKRFSARKLTKKFIQKIKRWTLDGFLRKLQTTGSIERTPGSGRPRSSQNVMLGSVEIDTVRMVL